MKLSNKIVCILLLLSCSISFAQFEIQIDAEKDAYYNTLTGPGDGLLWIPSAAYNDNGTPPDGDEDLSAYLYSAWDSTYFYVYEEVTDDYINHNNAAYEWQNDVFEIKIDPDPFNLDDNTVWAVDLTCFDSTDVDDAVWVSIDNLYPTGHSWAGTESPTREDYARRFTDTGYALELRLKWEWIATTNKGPVEPIVENVFGLAYMNHDNDDTQRDHSIEWAAVMLDAVWNDCQNHGYVEFQPDHKLKYVPENLRNFDNVNPDPDMYNPPGMGLIRESAVARDFGLEQNFPNPFNPVTTIPFSLHHHSRVTVDVIDSHGRTVDVLADQVMQAGRYTIPFDGSALSSGLYFYRLAYEDRVICKKMTLLK